MMRRGDRNQRWLEWERGIVELGSEAGYSTRAIARWLDREPSFVRRRRVLARAGRSVLRMDDVFDAAGFSR